MKGTEAYDHLIIYYFSGTGNARKCAEWIIDEGKNANMAVDLINIDRFEEVHIPEVKGKVLIGFCFPTHGFNMPPIMLKFLRQFPKMKGVSTFILNTRGGFKLHKFFIPGLSGLAQILAAAILILKGFKVKAMQPVDLPANWLFLHPGIKDKVVISMFQHYEKLVRSFAQKIIAGKRHYRAFWSLPIDLLVVPISLGYFLIGRFFLAKTLVATHQCNGCKACLEKCPVQAIKWNKERPFWTWKCESCMRCANICPERAIETAHLFSILVVYASIWTAGIIFTRYLLSFELIEQFIKTWMGDLSWDLMQSAFMVLYIFVAYRILHVLMGKHWFSKLIRYTSLSSYSWWRRYRPKKVVKF